TDAFPTVQLRYQVNPMVLVRATWSTGIARPGFLQNSASTSSNHDPTDPQITQGNPDLKPTTGDNFDLSFELYLPKGGILQPGASRFTANLAGFYEANGLQLRLAAEYVSKELFSLGGSKASDTIQDSRLTLDFTSSYQVAQHWTAYFNVKNITNEPLRFYVN